MSTVKNGYVAVEMSVLALPKLTTSLLPQSRPALKLWVEKMSIAPLNVLDYDYVGL